MVVTVSLRVTLGIPHRKFRIMEQIQSPFLGSKVPADKWEVIKKILKETGQRTLRYLLLHNLQLSSGDRGELII